MHLLGLLEEPVELLHERVASANRGDEAIRILHYVPCVLEGVPLREVVCQVCAVPERKRVERVAPVPLRVLAAHKAN